MFGDTLFYVDPTPSGDCVEPYYDGMFENALTQSNISDSRKKYKQLDILLGRFVELRQYESIKRNALSRKHKKMLNRNNVRELILRHIHDKVMATRKPEEAYESWNTQKQQKKTTEPMEETPIKKSSLNNDVEHLLDKLGSDNDFSKTFFDNKDETDKSLETDADTKLTSFLNKLDQSKSWTRKQFLIYVNGLESVGYDKTLHTFASDKRAIVTSHINNLQSLLHLNILRRNWKVAYDIFCLLIRFKKVDIRSLWPLGIEILVRRREEMSYFSQNGINKLKDEKFFEWLNTFFSINKGKSFGTSRNLIAAPVWRSGSRSHTPIYLICSLWDLAIKRKYSVLKEKTEELLLEPPFDSDGNIYYFRIICVFVENIKLGNLYLNFDTDQNIKDGEEDEFVSEFKNYTSKNEILSKIEDNNNIIISTVNKIKDLNFELPEDLIKDHINLNLVRLNDNVVPFRELWIAEQQLSSSQHESPSKIDLDAFSEQEEVTPSEYSYISDTTHDLDYS